MECDAAGANIYHTHSTREYISFFLSVFIFYFFVWVTFTLNFVFILEGKKGECVGTVGRGAVLRRSWRVRCADGSFD